jgi:hypothetical protein
MNIETIIERCTKAMNLPPEEINERWAGEFALSVLEMLGVDPGKNDPNCRLLFTEDVSEDLPRHAWIFYDGRHYDAECAQGVEDWRDLPVFRRTRGR